MGNGADCLFSRAACLTPNHVNLLHAQVDEGRVEILKRAFIPVRTDVKCSTTPARVHLSSASVQGCHCGPHASTAAACGSCLVTAICSTFNHCSSSKPPGCRARWRIQASSLRAQGTGHTQAEPRRRGPGCGPRVPDDRPLHGLGCQGVSKRRQGMVGLPTRPVVC